MVQSTPTQNSNGPTWLKIGFHITSVGLALGQVAPNVLFTAPATASPASKENKDNEWVNFTPVETNDFSDLNDLQILAKYSALPVPETRLQPSFSNSVLPEPPVRQQLVSCTQNCSNADLFVLQQPNTVPPRQILPTITPFTSSQQQTNEAFFHSDQTYLQSLISGTEGTSQTASSRANDFSQLPSGQPFSEERLAFETPASPSRSNSGLIDNPFAPDFSFQGTSIVGNEEFSGRARINATYPISQNLLIGGSVEAVNGTAFVDSSDEGARLNELYLAASLPSSPNLRLIAGQLDFSSYFDRNSFAKDGATQFFNGAFQTSPAIGSSLGNSNLGALINWSVNDNLDLRAAAFSSDRDLSDFNFDSYAGEVAYRSGNVIVRGTYVSGRDGGADTGFQNSFLIDRGNGQTGILPGDREVSYGINGEVYFPEANLGLFGRYGIYENQTLDLSGETFSLGVTLFDLLSDNDRLGVAYGQTVSNDSLQEIEGSVSPEVFEVFYDFEPVDEFRVGASIQQTNGFSDTVFQFRLGYDFGW
ncbi:hypothetical protein QGP82_07335 [Leptothoe sp. LEGE 181152]|nr:hypothetical protein [Leptothoe sp. LEGE 181152]